MAPMLDRHLREMERDWPELDQSDWEQLVPERHPLWEVTESEVAESDGRPAHREGVGLRHAGETKSRRAWRNLKLTDSSTVYARSPAGVSTPSSTSRPVLNEMAAR